METITQVSRYQKGKTNLDFTEARDTELQWHQLGHMQVCTLLQTDNHASTPPLSFLQAGCPSCCPTNSVKALKALTAKIITCFPASWLVSLWINGTFNAYKGYIMPLVKYKSLDAHLMGVDAHGYKLLVGIYELSRNILRANLKESTV